jgi:hypothetical protein
MRGMTVSGQSHRPECQYSSPLRRSWKQSCPVAGFRVYTANCARCCLSDIGNFLGTMAGLAHINASHQDGPGRSWSQKLRARLSSATGSRPKSSLITMKLIMPWPPARLKEASTAGGAGFGELGAECPIRAMQPAQVTRPAPSTNSNAQPTPRRTFAAVEAIKSSTYASQLSQSTWLRSSRTRSR